MNSDVSILLFLSDLSGSEKLIENLKKVDEDLQEIVDNEKDKEKREKLEAQVKRRKEKREAQVAKRKEADDRKNLLKDKYSPSKQKKEINGFLKLLMGLGIAGGLLAGFVGWATGDSKEAKEFRNKLNEKLEELKGKIVEEAEKALKAAGKYIRDNWKEWAKTLAKPVVNVASQVVTQNVARPIQEFVGGVTRSNSGIQISYNDVVNLRNNQVEFLTQNGITGESADAQLKQFDELMKRMKKTKTMEKQLEQARKRLERLKEQAKTEGRHNVGMEGKQKRLQEQIDLLMQNITQSHKMAADLWDGLNISDDDLKAQQEAVGTVFKQVGGPIVVPGSGSGDKVPMALPEGSFVLNREASKALDSVAPTAPAVSNSVLAPPTTEFGSSSASPVGKMQHGGMAAAPAKVSSATSGMATAMNSLMFGKKQAAAPSVSGSSNMSVVPMKNNLKLPSFDNPLGNFKSNLSQMVQGSAAKPSVSSNSKSMAATPGPMQQVSNQAAGIASAMFGTNKATASSPMNMGSNKAAAPMASIAGSSKAAIPTPVAHSQGAPARRQLGGTVGSVKARFDEANASHLTTEGTRTVRPVVVVKRRPAAPSLPTQAPAPQAPSGSSLNIVEVSRKLHRIKAGSRY